MSTLSESVEVAVAALNAATLEMRTARETFVTQSRSNVQETKQIVNDAIAISRVWHLDPVNGNDANDGTTYAKSKKTLHNIMAIAAPSTGHFVYLFGDLLHDHYSQCVASIAIRGSSPVQPSPDTFAYSPARRKLTFRPEALESPIVNGIKTTSLIQFAAPINLLNIDIYLADVDPTVGAGTRTHFISTNGSKMVIDGGDIYATDPNNIGRLIQSGSSAPAGFYFRGAIASAAQGRIFAGVAKGGDPNVGKFYDSNLTSN